MSTLDDLRATLHREADEVQDPHRYARPVAVRERIRVVRRRRAALAASSAVVAVALGLTAAGTVLDRGQRLDPATDVVGVEVPQKVSVYGFPYALTGTTTFSADHDRVRLDHSDRWQALSLVASGLGDGYATLVVDGEPVARAAGPDAVEVPVPVFDGTPTVRLELDGAAAGARAGLAVYGATGVPASGITNGTAVFRDQVAGRRLRAGAFARSGDSEVSVPFTGRLADSRIAYYCRTDEKGLWLNVETDEDGVLGTSCSSDDSVDAGAGGSTVERAGRARQYVVRAYLTRGSEGPRVTSPDADFGVAVYDDPAAQTVLGMRVADTVEDNGRLWTLDRVVPQGEPGDPVETTLDASQEDRLIGQVAAGGTTWTTWQGELSRGESDRMASSAGVGGAGMAVGGFLPRGDTYRVTMHGRAGAPFRGALLVYRPV